MFTRILVARGICCLVILVSGCQTVSHSNTPIVGDSMSMGPGCGPGGYGAGGGDYANGGYSNQGCTDQGYGGQGYMMDQGYVEGGTMDGGYAMDGSITGCAGSACDGRCGGRCGLAQMQMRMRNRAGNRSHGNHHLASAIGCNHRRCANGSCGGVAGPEMGSVTYPYYTLRGPRDFLMSNPPPIGP